MSDNRTRGDVHTPPRSLAPCTSFVYGRGTAETPRAAPQADPPPPPPSRPPRPQRHVNVHTWDEDHLKQHSRSFHAQGYRFHRGKDLQQADAVGRRWLSIEKTPQSGNARFSGCFAVNACSCPTTRRAQCSPTCVRCSLDTCRVVSPDSECSGCPCTGALERAAERAGQVSLEDGQRV